MAAPGPIPPYETTTTGVPADTSRLWGAYFTDFQDIPRDDPDFNPTGWMATELKRPPPTEQRNPYLPVGGSLLGFTPFSNWIRTRNARCIASAVKTRDHLFLGHVLHKSGWHRRVTWRFADQFVHLQSGIVPVFTASLDKRFGLPHPIPLTRWVPAAATRDLVLMGDHDTRTQHIQLNQPPPVNAANAVTDFRVFTDLEFIKLLASGGCGHALLYNAINPDGIRTPIVVKTATTVMGREDLVEECSVLDRLQGARHLAQPFYGNAEHEGPPPNINLPAPNGGNPLFHRRTYSGVPAWDEPKHFLALEYLNIGTVHDIVGHTRRKGLWWPERALWSLFLNLVQGVMTMAHPVKEWYPDPDWDPREPVDENYNALPEDQKRNPTRLVHFDLDPLNVLATWDHQADPNHPVFKISDFGISKDMYEVMRDFRISPQRKVKVMWDRRRYGKQSCYFPEQFHETWDYLKYPNMFGQSYPETFFSDDRYARPTIAGRYRHEANIYCIGQIMWSVLTGLWAEDPRRDMHLPTATRPDYTTYGWRLGRSEYFGGPGRLHKLRKLVMQCLASRPTDRPSLKKLFRKCRAAMGRLRANRQETVRLNRWVHSSFRRWVNHGAIPPGSTMEAEFARGASRNGPMVRPNPYRDHVQAQPPWVFLPDTTTPVNTPPANAANVTSVVPTVANTPVGGSGASGGADAGGSADAGGGADADAGADGAGITGLYAGSGGGLFVT